MKEILSNINATKKFLNQITDFKPDYGIILGTGLGKLVDSLKKVCEINYSDIPYFPVSTVESHSGKLIFGKLSGKNVVVMQGRFHYYEGYSLQDVTYPVRVFKALGVSTLIVSNACGGLNPNFTPGDIMIISDHINLLGKTPLMGINEDELGPRFPDMFNCYTKELRELANKVAADKNIKVQNGVYTIMSGPCLETAAEYRMLKIIGSDVIGMSTVPEVTVAVHAGLKVLGLSVVTDNCDPDTLEPVNIEKIIKTANETEPNLVKIVEGVLENV